MKKLLLSILLILPMFALQSCDEKETSAAITFPDSAIPTPVFLAEAGTQTITFNSTKAWAAGVEAGKTWCTVTPANGVAGAAVTMTITVAKNETYDSRSAVVTIISEGVEQPITVTQSQNDSFSFTGAPKDALPATESKFVITTAENTGAPKVGTLPEWITVATAPAAKGLTNTTLTFTVKANTTFDNREAKITITSGGKDESFVVKQSQVDSFEISGQPTEIFGINGGTFVITATGNTGTPTVGELPEWITLAPTAKGLTETKLTFTVKENTTDGERSGQITITSGSESDKFTVKQLNPNSPINIPDAIFKAYLVGTFDTNNDNEISYSEAAKVTIISCYNMSISSLSGIEHFTALTELHCYDNQLTTLDVSSNTQLTLLNCAQNQLTTLDVANNTKFIYFECSENQLTNFDVSKNTKLIQLGCSENQLTTLEVSKNTALTKLDCSNNQLTTLEVSKNTALIELYCPNNQLTILDVTVNTALMYFDCSTNQLETLDVTKNTALQRFGCNKNQLKSIDISKNAKLVNLYCDPMNDAEGNNVLTTLFLTQVQWDVNSKSEFIDAPVETALTVQ